MNTWIRKINNSKNDSLTNPNEINKVADNADERPITEVETKKPPVKIIDKKGARVSAFVKQADFPKKKSKIKIVRNKWIMVKIIMVVYLVFLT